MGGPDVPPPSPSLRCARGRGLAALAALLVLAAPATAAETRLTEPAVRAFVARQEAAWNGRDAGAWAASFTPDAVFVAQARNSNGGVTANGTSTLVQATAQAKRYFARSRFQETGAVDAVVVAPDGQSAQVTGHEVAHIEARPDRPARTLCAETRQTVVLARGRIRSKGQTDTDVRCPR